MNAPLRDFQSGSNGAVSRHPGRLWSLWDMLHSYSPIYKIALSLQSLRTTGLLFRNSVYRDPPKDEIERLNVLLQTMRQRCSEYGLDYTADMARRSIEKPSPMTYAELFVELEHLNDSLIYELDREAVFRVPLDQKKYYEQADLFGPKVSAAFPSCERDIRKAGSCYALGQEDACVHHLMLVLERGLKALAVRVGVSGHHANWQVIINEIVKNLKSSSLPRPERDFYSEVNAKFSFLKVAYRNHSEHAHDDPYDMEKARSILNNVRDFMQALEKGGLSE